jgi:hypothetical protein
MPCRACCAFCGGADAGYALGELAWCSASGNGGGAVSTAQHLWSDVSPGCSVKLFNFLKRQPPRSQLLHLLS